MTISSKKEELASRILLTGFVVILFFQLQVFGSCLSQKQMKRHELIMYFSIYIIRIRLESSHFHRLFAQNWKVGKRMAEHGDDASRINVLKAIWSAPRTQEMENGLEREIWAFKYDLGKMEAGVKHLLTVANDQLNRVSYIRVVFKAPFNVQLLQYKNLRERENKTLGHSFCEMGFALKVSEDINRLLCESIFIFMFCLHLQEDRPIFVKIGMNYEATSKLWNDHTVEEWKPVYDLLLAYRSLISGWLQLIGLILAPPVFH